MNNLLVLFDADELLYTAAHASQITSHDIVVDEFEEPVINFRYAKESKLFLEANPDKGYNIKKKVIPTEEWIAKYNLLTLIKTAITSCKTKDYSLFLSGKDNFRNTVATIASYKSGRPEEKPHHYNYLKEVLLEEEFAVVADNMEADDALGIMSTEYAKEGKYTPIIASQDKDLRQVPGLWYSKKEDCIKEISETDGHKSFFRQLLIGDSTDNIPGIYGMGPKTASSIIDNLEDPREMYQTCLQEWTKAINNKKFKYKTDKSVEEIILEIGQLLWIKRYRDQVWSPEIYA